MASFDLWLSQLFEKSSVLILLTAEIIVVTSHRIDESLGGVERFVVSFSSWCNRKGFAVKVVSRSLSLFSVKIGQGADKYATSGGQNAVTVKKLKLPYVLYCFGMALFSFLAFISLLGLIKSSRLTSKGAIVLHSQDMNFAATATVLAGKILSVRTVLHQHGPYVNMLTGNSRRIEMAFNMFNCRLCNRMIVTDRLTGSYVTRVSGHEDRIAVIPAAVDTSVFKPSVKMNSGCFTVGYVGRLSSEKNIESLLRAFKDLQSSTDGACKLILVGDGDRREQLQKLSVDLGVWENVSFAGFQTDVARFSGQFDVFVLPSILEGTPISLMEAMAAGRAVVCSNIASLNEIIADGVDGLLFRVDDAKEIAGLLLLLYNSPDYTRKLGLNAQESAKKFDVDVVYSKILSSYR